MSDAIRFLECVRLRVERSYHRLHYSTKLYVDGVVGFNVLRRYFLNYLNHILQ